MKKLLALVIANHATPQQIRCDTQAQSDRAEVFLKGVISADFGVGAEAMRTAMQQAEGRDVALYINSPGGDVFEAREMQGILAAYPGKVTAIVQGVAASAANSRASSRRLRFPPCR